MPHSEHDWRLLASLTKYPILCRCPVPSLLGLFWKPTGDGWDGIPLTSYWTAKLTGRVHGERNICPSSQPQEESSGASSTAPGDG